MVDRVLEGESQRSNGLHQTLEYMIDNYGNLHMKEEEEEE